MPRFRWSPNASGRAGLHERWNLQIPGYAAHGVFADAHPGTVHVADGWGVAYSVLALHAYDLQSGARTGSVRTGTSVRCMAAARNGDVIALSDRRLHRFDPVTLEERGRIERGVPTASDSIAVRGSHAAIANWLRPTVGVVDLESGSIRRRQGHAISVLTGSDGPVFLVALVDGGVWSLDLEPATIRLFTTSRPAVSAASGNGRLALLDGKPHIVVDEHKLDHREVRTKRILLYDASSGVRSGELLLADGASTIAFGPSGLWAYGGGDLQHVADPEWNPIGRRWKVFGQTWRGVDTSGRVGITVEEGHAGETATLRAYSLDVG